MEELIYLLKVANNSTTQKSVAQRLGLDSTPNYVRVATLAKLSNYGYPTDEDAAVLSVDAEGIVIGIDGQPQYAHAFVPWSNIAYLADGADLTP